MLSQGQLSVLFEYLTASEKLQGSEPQTDMEGVSKFSILEFGSRLMKMFHVTSLLHYVRRNSSHSFLPRERFFLQRNVVILEETINSYAYNVYQYDISGSN